MKDPAAAYIETLAKMAQAGGDSGTMKVRPRGWNRLVDRLQEARKILAQTAEGRSAVATMMGDSRVTVRLWAASHALHWPESSAEARSVLEAIGAEQAYGLNRLNAEMTLSEFDAGRLNPDW